MPPALLVNRESAARPLNVNFFCHTPAKPDAERDAAWKARLSAYYNEFGLAASAVAPAAQRVPFDEEMCEVVEDLAPEVVSFHFGLPAQALLSRVKAAALRRLSPSARRGFRSAPLISARPNR